jgi:hypothetical protein
LVADIVGLVNSFFMLGLLLFLARAVPVLYRPFALLAFYGMILSFTAWAIEFASDFAEYRGPAGNVWALAFVWNVSGTCGAIAAGFAALQRVDVGRARGGPTTEEV